MGRIFEVRKSTMFARWDRMAKQFTRIGKEIAIAVKAGGTLYDSFFKINNQVYIYEVKKRGITPKRKK